MSIGFDSKVISSLFNAVLKISGKTSDGFLLVSASTISEAFSVSANSLTALSMDKNEMPSNFDSINWMK